MEIVAIVLLVGCAFYATRYLCKTNTGAQIRSIWYVIGILFAPLTIVLAVLKWLIVGRA